MSESELHDRMLLQADDTPQEPSPPALSDLAAYSRNRVRRFIIQSALFGGATGEMVAGLYADLADDEGAGRYLDARFLLRRIPPDWRLAEDAVLDLADAARERGVDLAAVWRRAEAIATEQPEEDPMDALARLAGVEVQRRPARSMFDDPEDLDAYDDGDEDLDLLAPFPPGRLPGLRDLSVRAQEAIRLYVVEDRLERGLAPVTLMELYRGLDNEGDERGRQYLDRVFVDGEIPNDWREVQVAADEVFELATRRGRDPGRLFAEARRGRGGLAALEILTSLRDQLLR
jgi:hypothetical protein